MKHKGQKILQRNCVVENKMAAEEVGIIFTEYAIHICQTFEFRRGEENMETPYFLPLFGPRSSNYRLLHKYLPTKHNPRNV